MTPPGRGPPSTVATRPPVPAATSDPDLVILADTHGRELSAALVSRVVPHLAASASEAIGVVGPLVQPGRTACLRCLDLARADRDPAWPLILAQLAGQAGADPMACDTVLATMVAAQAAAQALAFLDLGAEAAVAVTNGTLELVLPDWQWRRRTWHPHPRCGCHGTATEARPARGLGQTVPSGHVNRVRRTRPHRGGQTAEPEREAFGARRRGQRQALSPERPAESMLRRSGSIGWRGHWAIRIADCDPFPAA